MAMQYSVEAILSARDTNFTTTMDNAQKSMSKVQKSMGLAEKSMGGTEKTMGGAQKAMGGLSSASAGVSASIGKIATAFGVFKLISGTISALSSGFSSLVGEMNESSVAWQVFESNLSMLGTSSGEIDTTRKSLEKFAQQTIYSASDMAQTYGQMAAIGVEDTETLV